MRKEWNSWTIFFVEFQMFFSFICCPRLGFFYKFLRIQDGRWVNQWRSYLNGKSKEFGINRQMLFSIRNLIYNSLRKFKKELSEEVCSMISNSEFISAILVILIRLYITNLYRPVVCFSSVIKSCKFAVSDWAEYLTENIYIYCLTLELVAGHRLKATIE